MRIASLVLLGALAGAGVFGGIALLAAPDGSALGLDLLLLPDWYPSDYRWAGILLLLGFGAAPILVGSALLLRPRWGGIGLVALGLALVLWVGIQIAMIGLILPPMQLGFGAIGIVLIVLGSLRLNRRAVA
jgi:hypothetical protein